METMNYCVFPLARSGTHHNTFSYCTPDLQMYFYYLFICLFSFVEPVKIQPAQPKGIENLGKRDLSA